MGNLRRSPGLIALCSTATLLFCADKPPRAPAAASRQVREAAKAQVNQNYGKLPLSFEENLGQTDRSKEEPG